MVIVMEDEVFSITGGFCYPFVRPRSDSEYESILANNVSETRAEYCDLSEFERVP